MLVILYVLMVTLYIYQPLSVVYLSCMYVNSTAHYLFSFFFLFFSQVEFDDLSIHSRNVPYQHILSTHPLITLCQYTLSQNTLSSHPINTSSHHTLFFSQVESDDLSRFGLIPEFIGRFPVIVSTRSLDLAQMLQVITEPKNALLKQVTPLAYLDTHIYLLNP